MSRRSAISKITDTQYFQGVTPLWVAPGRELIEERYRDAINSLVEWIGPNWMQTESHFFRLRHILIAACESWAQHDWDRDEAWIAERKNDEKNRVNLQRAWTRFSTALSRSPYRRQKRLLGMSLLADVVPVGTTALTNGQLLRATERALEKFGRNLESEDKGFSRFGPVEYAGLPTRLPRRQIALALSLADQITYWRNDDHQNGSLDCPHKPNVSRNLPWKSIAEFASANLVDGEEMLEANSVQTLVTNLMTKVALVCWRPRNG